MSFTKWQVASLRSSAKSYYSLLAKKKRLEEKREAAIAKFEADIESIEASMEVIQTPVKTFFNGYGIEDLIVKAGEGTEAKYVLLNPETILPTDSPIIEVASDVLEAANEENNNENNNEENNF